MKRIKKFVAVLLLSFTLFNSIFASYSMTVKAAEAIPATMTVIEALLSLFGLEVGLGNQKDFFSNSEFTDFVSAVANGQTVSMPSYGEVNFSDSESILSFMTWASALTYTAADGDVLKLAKVLDSTSYKNTGTAATNSMQQHIDNFVGDYNGSSEALAEDVQETFRVITGGGSSDDNNDDNNNMNSSRWKIFGGIIASVLLGSAGKFCDYLDSLKTPEETEYTEYDSAFSDADGFVEGKSYPVYSDSKDSYWYNQNKEVIGYYLIDNIRATLLGASTNESYFFCAVVSNDSYIFYYCHMLNGSPDASLNIYYPNYTYFNGSSYSSSFLRGGDLCKNFTSLYCPVFPSLDAANLYLNEGDTSGILNLVDDSAYPNFKKAAPSAHSTLSTNIDKWMNTNPSINDFPDAVPDLLDVSDSVAGTGDAVPSIDDAIAEKAGVDPGTDSDTDTDTGTSINYMGILGKILNAILSLPKSIWEFFTDPLGVILQDWQELLQWLKDFQLWLANCLADLLEAVTGLGEPKNPWGTIDGSGSGSDSSGSGTVNLLNGILLLVYILFKLLQIFLHLLEFIINIFKIPATPGFITGDFAIGFEFIKTVQLSPLNISVYDFLMGLIHILVIFSVVKVLKKHIDKLRI